MRILIVGSHERAVMNFRSTMISRLSENHEVDVVIWSRDARQRADIEALGARVAYLNSTSGSLSVFSDLRAVLRLGWQMILRRPDRALFYASKPIGIGASIARLLGIKYTCLMEGLGTGFREGGTLWRVNHRLFSFAFAGATTVFLLNRENRESLIGWGLCAPQKIKLLDGIGVDLDRFQPQPIRNPVPTALFLGRITHSKGVPRFFEAARLALRKRGDFRFFAAGPRVENSDGLTERNIDELTQPEGLTYLGDSNDVPRLLADCWCVIIPSIDGCEGLPMVLQEAFAAGRPVIGTDVAGTRDGLKDSDAGLLVYPDDSTIIADAAIQLLSDRDRCERMGEEARKIAERRFDRRAADAELISAILA